MLKHLLDIVILGESESTALLDDLMQMCDFTLEVLNNFARLFFLLFGLLDKFPSFIDFTLEDSDGV